VFVEGTLIEKLRKLEALHAGTAVAGEREAAHRAAERIRARLEALRGREKEVVLAYRLQDPWVRKLFVALCRRYGLSPYRRPGQRYTTVLVRAPKTFHDRTLWPEFQALAKELEESLEELTDRVIRGRSTTTSAKRRRLRRSSRSRMSELAARVGRGAVLADEELRVRREHLVRQELAQPSVRPAFDDPTRDEVEVGARVHVVGDRRREDREDARRALAPRVSPREEPVLATLH
jgi:hypothetical protein